MSNKTLYICSECDNKVMAEYKQQLPPTVYCGCGELIVMDKEVISGEGED